MSEVYKETIARLIAAAPFQINPDVIIEGRPPTMASSEFLTNKEQGDWAERIVHQAINQNSEEFLSVKYGRSDSLGAGDPGFADFYKSYQNELNSIGKKPDLLIFQRTDVPVTGQLDLSSEEVVQRAVAAIEVRSSSFLANKYARYMEARTKEAELECARIKGLILTEPLSSTLRDKSPEIHALLSRATLATFRELDFRLNSWSSSEHLRMLSEQLKSLKDQIKTLHKRDYLSITPKVEDLALVNRWIQRFGVRHFYLQVFFDKAYVIAFKDILEISSDPGKEGVVFAVERDSKNQGKTTIKINVQVGREILGKIDMPAHKSVLREMDRGRLLFYVAFDGGKGYLDKEVLERDIINAI